MDEYLPKRSHLFIKINNCDFYYSITKIQEFNSISKYFYTLWQSETGAYLFTTEIEKILTSKLFTTHCGIVFESYDMCCVHPTDGGVTVRPFLVQQVFVETFFKFQSFMDIKSWSLIIHGPTSELQLVIFTVYKLRFIIINTTLNR